MADNWDLVETLLNDRSIDDITILENIRHTPHKTKSVYGVFILVETIIRANRLEMVQPILDRYIITRIDKLRTTKNLIDRPSNFKNRIVTRYIKEFIDDHEYVSTIIDYATFHSKFDILESIILNCPISTRILYNLFHGGRFSNYVMAVASPELTKLFIKILMTENRYPWTLVDLFDGLLYTSNYDAVKKLLNCGYDVDYGQPLAIATNKRDIPMMNMLLEYGSQKNINEVSFVAGSCTILSAVCKSNCDDIDVEVVEILLKHGADPNECHDYQFRESALESICRSTRTHLIKNRDNPSDKTARRCQNSTIVARMLLNAGGDPLHTHRGTGDNMYIMCHRMGLSDIIDCIVEVSKVDVNQKFLINGIILDNPDDWTKWYTLTGPEIAEYSLNAKWTSM